MLLSYEVVKPPPRAGVLITARRPQGKLPYIGYWYDYGDLPQSIDVLPRQDVMFSVPIDVLVPGVYLRIEVEPRMAPASGERRRIYLEFGWYSVPEDVRAEIDRLLVADEGQAERLEALEKRRPIRDVRCNRRRRL